MRKDQVLAKKRQAIKQAKQEQIAMLCTSIFAIVVIATLFILEYYN